MHPNPNMQYYKRGINDHSNADRKYSECYDEFVALMAVSKDHMALRAHDLLTRWRVRYHAERYAIIVNHMEAFLREPLFPSGHTPKNYSRDEAGRWVVSSLMIGRDTIVADIAERRRRPIDMTNPAAQSAHQIAINELHLKLYAYKILIHIIETYAPKHIPWPSKNAA